MSAPTVLERAQQTWPGVAWKDIMVIGPLGSRNDGADQMIFNRRNGEVITGWRQHMDPDRACYRGTLEEFAQAVEAKYSDRDKAAHRARLYREYMLAVEFLLQLPELPEAVGGSGVPESGLGPADQEPGC